MAQTKISIAASTFMAAFKEPKATRIQTQKQNKKNQKQTRRSSDSSSSKSDGIWVRGQTPTKKNNRNARSPHRKNHYDVKTKSPQLKNNRYDGPDRTLDRLTKGSPDAGLYFAIRKACNRDCDNVAALKKLLPQRECEGQDFGVWPRQHLLLHGLVKQGCVNCVEHLLSIGISVNSRRMKDDCTPLHIAFYNLQGATLDKMVQMLLDNGADTKATNKWSEAPCMFKFKEQSLKSKSAESKKREVKMPSPCGVADLELEPPVSFDLGPPATPTPKAQSAGKMFVYENENLKAKKIKFLAEITTLAASSYCVFKVASQIADWKTSIRNSPQLTAKTGKAACASSVANAFHEAVLRRVMA